MLRAADPPTPAEGVVAFAYVDGEALGAAGASTGAFRPLGTLLDLVLPGSGRLPEIAALDGAGSMAVLAGGTASLTVDEVAPGRLGIAATKARFGVSVPGAGGDAVRKLLEGAKYEGGVREDAPESKTGSVSGFTIAYGEPNVRPSGETASVRIAAHRAALVSDGSKGVVCAQVYVDLNAVRRAAPDAMDNTALARVLGVWALGNARDVMVTARIVSPADVTTRDPSLVLPPGATPPEPYAGPAMVRVDVTWSARSEDPSRIGSLTLAAAFWAPGKDKLPSVPGAGPRWVAAVRTDLGLMTMLALRTHAARLEPNARGAFSRDVDRWARAHGAAMDRLVQATRGWLVLWPSADGVALDWRLVPGAALAMETFGRDVGGVLTPFPGVAGADASGVRVATMPGMVVGFVPAAGGGVLGQVEFDEGAAERVRSAVGARVKQ